MELDDALLATMERLWPQTVIGHRDVEPRARLLLLDTLGCAIAGVAEPEVRALARELGQDGPLRLPGLDQTLSIDAFTFCFAAGACWHEACEGLAVAHGRPGLHAIPAVLGAALARGAALGQVLDAIVAGYEVGGRVGIAWRIKPGMHVDGIWGSFAATAAACRLAGMTPGATLAALNHAACHLPFSLYRPITWGSTARNLYVGHAAVFGAAAAAATRAGMGGPPGSMAEAASLSLGHAPAGITVEPGHCLLLDGYLKFYAAVKHVHYGALAASRWYAQRPEHGHDAADIDRITLTIYEEAQTYCGNRAPSSPIQAQFSLTYGLAWMLLHGDLTPAAYAAGSLADPAVRRLEALVEVHTRPGPARNCDLVVSVAGTPWHTHVDSVPGEPGQQMGQDAVTAKFLTYTTPVIGPDHAARLVDRLLHGAAHLPLTLD